MKLVLTTQIQKEIEIVAGTQEEFNALIVAATQEMMDSPVGMLMLPNQPIAALVKIEPTKEDDEK